ncbi:hypothetical protein [Streptomyces vilmorinianum]|uniref:hypothetical protein n=1 Tax=Streptomyces vilmorinianum TaxID=3051092 RepID=UPI0010FAE4F2|nr:hypothetical protein [Streptomyces vilmorinianum]
MTTAAPSRLRLLPVLLVACVVTLCLTGMARPATAIPGMAGSVRSMSGVGHMVPGMHADEAGPASSVSDAHSLQRPCPMSSVSDCAQSSVPPVGGEQSACSHAGAAKSPAFMQPGPPRSGVPPPLAPPSPPEPTRLCVIRT